MIIKKLCTVLSILPVLLFTTAQGVVALEIEITGNSGGSNEVTVTEATTTQVTQTNTATVNNDIAVDANTGGNTANNNSGNTTIETGNVETNVQVENSLNSSTASTECCSSNTNSVIITNNSNTEGNTVVVNSSSNTSLEVNQIASIQNTVAGSANTGGNTAMNNGRDVTIKTGNIKHTDTIANTKINYSDGILSAGNPVWNVKISGNSSDTNTVILTLRNDVISSIYNNANINNISLWNLNTGENRGDKNNGDVTIVTGSIYSTTSIKNDGINVSKVEVECCEKEEVDPPTPPTPPVPPSDTNGGNGGGNDKVSNGGGSSSGTGGSSGSSLGSVLGAILPATGASFWLFATIANILMFLLGLYLRLKAGRSPCVAYATR